MECYCRILVLAPTHPAGMRREKDKDMKKFELLTKSYSENSLNFYNKNSVTEKGDYQLIAHVSEFGGIKWNVELETIPADVSALINDTARTNNINWMSKLNAMSDDEKYDYLQDCVIAEDLMHVAFDMDDETLEEKIEYLVKSAIERG